MCAGCSSGFCLQKKDTFSDCLGVLLGRMDVPYNTQVLSIQCVELDVDLSLE